MLGICSPRRHRFTGMGIPIINLRRSSDRLRYIMGIHIPVRKTVYLERLECKQKAKLVCVCPSVLYLVRVWEKKGCVGVSSWWRHQMESSAALLALCAGNSPVIGEFPAQRPVTRSFDVFFDLRLNKRLSKQSWGWWFETPSRPLWRHCNVCHHCCDYFPGAILNCRTLTTWPVTRRVAPVMATRWHALLFSKRRKLRSWQNTNTLLVWEVYLLSHLS